MSFEGRLRLRSFYLPRMELLYMVRESCPPDASLTMGAKTVALTLLAQRRSRKEEVGSTSRSLSRVLVRGSFEPFQIPPPRRIEEEQNSR